MNLTHKFEHRDATKLF